MIKIEDKQTCYFDVDNTLVMWDFGLYPELEDKKVEFKQPHCNWSMWLIPHEANINELIMHKFKGHTVVVWSAAGADWAESVIKGLNLEQYVDIVISKPTCFYDDLPPSEFMHVSSNLYKPFKSNNE